jgi:hypothetical protein
VAVELLVGQVGRLLVLEVLEVSALMSLVKHLVAELLLRRHLLAILAQAIQSQLVLVVLAALRAFLGLKVLTLFFLLSHLRVVA